MLIGFSLCFRLPVCHLRVSLLPIRMNVIYLFCSLPIPVGIRQRGIRRVQEKKTMGIRGFPMS